jgi:hypothetical protein
LNTVQIADQIDACIRAELSMQSRPKNKENTVFRERYANRIFTLCGPRDDDEKMNRCFELFNPPVNIFSFS